MGKKQDYTYFVIQEAVFRTNCTFFVGRDNKDIHEEIKKTADPETIKDWEFNEADVGNCYYYKDKKGRNVYAIALKRTGNDEENVATLAHEVNHLIFRILHNLSIEVRIENDEVFCYLHAFYFKEALKVLNKINHK